MPWTSELVQFPTPTTATLILSKEDLLFALMICLRLAHATGRRRSAPRTEVPGNHALGPVASLADAGRPARGVRRRATPIGNRGHLREREERVSSRLLFLLTP